MGYSDKKTKLELDTDWQGGLKSSTDDDLGRVNLLDSFSTRVAGSGTVDVGIRELRVMERAKADWELHTTTYVDGKGVS